MASRYVDSQESQEEMQSQDLFQPYRPQEAAASGTHENGPDHGACSFCVINTQILKEVLKELKDLKALTEKLQGGNTSSGRFRVEKSLIEKPLNEYLKERYAKSPFLGDPDIELQQKVTSLRRRLMHEVDSQEMLRVAFSYCARKIKMVDFRAQTKAKLLCKGQANTEDLGTKSLVDLQQVLFKKFSGNAACQEETYRLTIALRAFCHQSRFFKKQGAAEGDASSFWTSFKSYLQDILDDNEENNDGGQGEETNREVQEIVTGDRRITDDRRMEDSNY